jgi:biotin transport system substrate-specific component
MLLKGTLVATGVGLLTASAWISIPFYPVPITMQTLAVLLVGGVLGPRLGVASVVGYIALGLMGAPVFHNGLGGPALLAGPTGGYLMGFVPAAYLMGLAGRRTWTLSKGILGALSRLALLAVGAIAAEAAIYALGLPWLALYTGNDAGATVAAGLVPFLLGDLVKTALAVTALYGGKNLLERLGPRPF